ncbi:hypothetical protein F5880DRAFT_1618223 [Lentinula raphanica]|nr:hypothetical protein F5880DRAFT_1618223 [Lentinula raphanica]
MAGNARDVERQVFILDEAEEEELDWGDEDDEDEDLAVREEAERARQKAESVQLRDPRELTLLERVVSRWEQRLNVTGPTTTEPTQSVQRRKIRPLPRSSLSPSPVSPSPSQSLVNKPPPPVFALPSESSGDISPAAPEAQPSTLTPPAYATSSESSGDLFLAAPEAKSSNHTPPAHTSYSEGSGDISLAAPEAKSSTFTPPAYATSSESSGDLSLAAPEASTPPAYATSSESSGDPSLAAPEAKGSSLAPPAQVHPTLATPEAILPLCNPPAHIRSSEGDGDASLVAFESELPALPPPEAKSLDLAPPPAHAASSERTAESPTFALPPSSERTGDSIIPVPVPPALAPAHALSHAPSSERTGDLSLVAPASSTHPSVSSAPLQKSSNNWRAPPPDLPLWILPPSTKNLWEPNSRYFVLVDDEWYGDESSCPPGYEYRERERGYFRHDRGPTPPPPTTTLSADTTVLVIDDDQPIEIDVDVDVDDGFSMDVDPPHHEVLSSENGEGDTVMADQTLGKVVTDGHEDDADEFEFEHDSFDLTEEQHELAEWIKRHHVPTSGPFPYHIYHRGSERAIVERINHDIASESVSLNLIRAAFISQFPGGFYLQARSMLPGNVPLALYLNLIPNLIHPRRKKFSVNDGTVDNPPSTIEQFNPSSQPKAASQSASDDMVNEITPSNRQSRFRLPDFEEAGYPLPVEPRIPKMTVSAKYQTMKRPPRLYSAFNFRRDVEAQWKAACSSIPKLKDVKFEARCSQRCENAIACQHDPPFQKRFTLDRLVLRGGLALVPHKLVDLKIAESIDEGILVPFLQYPNADLLPSRLPPSISWSFTAGESVIYVPEGKELQDVVKGDEGVIQRDGTLECEVLFSRSQANVSVLKRHLRKKWRLAQTVELSPHTPEVVLRTREQLGYSGVSTLHEDHFMPAGQTGIITKVRLEEVDVWITEINSICTVHPNSVREVVESSNTPGLESRFQPRLSNLGATIALKPHLLAIQKVGNLDQKADLADIAHSFVSREVNRFDLRGGEYRAQNRSPAVTSMLTSIDQMTSFVNSTIHSTLLGYVATEGAVPRTEYTGRIPWLHVEVKPISGERKGYLGRVFDVKSEWKNTKSGLLVLIRFQNPSLIGNLDEWYDYDQLRRVDNGGFIHESTFTKQISSYFNFRMGYIPRHREDELPVTDLSTRSADTDGSRTPKKHWTAVDYSVPAWDPSSRTPNPYASSSSSTMSTPSAKHWILDPRICKGLAGREIWVNVRSEKDPVRVSLHVGSSGEIEISCQDNHVGGSKVNVAQRSVDYRAILSNPRCSKVTKGHSASGLYIICEGEHTGKLVRRANYFAEGNLWVLQVMRSVFHPDRRKQFSVEVDSDDRVLKRIPGNALAMVHEARSDSDAANKLMCIIRKAAGGNTNGYDVDGHGRIIKIGHA